MWKGLFFGIQIFKYPRWCDFERPLICWALKKKIHCIVVYFVIKWKVLKGPAD